MDVLVVVLIMIAGLGALLLGAGVRIVTQYERGVVFRFGRVLPETRGPGLSVIVPFADRMRKVNMQIVTQPVPAQDGITRDNVTVRVDAVIYYRVVDPVRVAVDVQDYAAAILQVAQASLRSIIGKSDLDDLLSNRERLNQGLELMIDSPAVGWGVHLDRVEIKDVALPESMKRSMSRQAESERERRSRVITAEGELQASRTLAEAAEVMTAHPAALQLRLLQTVVEVAAEKNSTMILPFPVELLRFLDGAREAASGNGAAAHGTAQAGTAATRPVRDPAESEGEAGSPVGEGRSPVETGEMEARTAKGGPALEHGGAEGPAAELGGAGGPVVDNDAVKRVVATANGAVVRPGS
ncbi:slipin family protein [Pseudonocardia sp. C8]|uniref:slipin family protein n=1 Tax=Pseudonocardia sp. C8 TaxID=2762759 RepID=UPI001643404D|nr:slipin family protein [Pseudonocardia sp. C8]